MNKIFFMMPLIVVCSFVVAGEKDVRPKKIDTSPMRDGIRRKLSNPVARLQVDYKFDDVMKNERTSPRKTYESIQDKVKEKEELRRRSGSLDKQ
jgi:hypothetical protein